MSKNWINFPRIEGQDVAAGACGSAGRHVRARDRARRLLRAGDAHVSQAYADGVDLVHRAASSARLRHDEVLVASDRRPGRRRACSATRGSRFACGRLTENMRELARNSDGDELLFVHAGSGDLFCDFGHMTFRDGDYIVLPRGTMWRIEPREALLAADDRGDRQRLSPAGSRDAGRACAVRSGRARDAEDQRSLPEAAGRQRVEGGAEAAQSDFDDRLSVQSAGRAGVEGDGRAGEVELARHPADDEPPLSPAAVGAHDVPGRALRRLHVRAAADRERSGRAEGAVLPQQRRFRRGDLLSRRQFLQPRQHQGRDDHVPSGGLYARAASEGVRGRARRRSARRPTRSR